MQGPQRHRSNRLQGVLLLFFLAAHGGLQAQVPPPLSLTGPSVVRLGGEAQYTADVGGNPADVVWSVNGYAGGTGSTGPITAAGVFSPASTIFAGHSVTISATTQANPASSASMKVKVLNPLPRLTSGTAIQTVPGGTFLLNIRGDGFVSGSQLQVAGADVATVFVSSNDLESTVSLTPGTTTINVGVLNPNAGQKSPVTRMLPINATVPTLSTTPASVAFGNVPLDTPSTQPVTLTSTGTAPVIINSAALSGTGFTMSGATFPVTLNPGLAIALDVQFDPLTAGPLMGQLTVQSNSSTNGTVVIGLTGTGEPHQVTLTWDAPSSSPIPVAGYNVYRSTGAGAAYQLLNSSVDAKTTFVDSAVQPGLTYNYIVESVDTAGMESLPSNQATASIP